MCLQIKQDVVGEYEACELVLWLKCGLDYVFCRFQYVCVFESWLSSFLEACHRRAENVLLLPFIYRFLHPVFLFKSYNGLNNKTSLLEQTINSSRYKLLIFLGHHLFQ